MGTVTNPLAGLVEGLLQGHQLGMQLKRQQMEEQAFRTNQALHEQQMSIQDIMNEQMLRERGAKDVTNGMVQEPGSTVPGMQPMQGAEGLPTPGAQQVGGILRKAGGNGRFVATLTDRQGQKKQYEMPSPEEQQQLAVNREVASKSALMRGEAGAQQDIALDLRKRMLSTPGLTIAAPQGLEGIGYAAGTPILKSELPGLIETIQKIRNGNQYSLKPGEVRVSQGDIPGMGSQPAAGQQPQYAPNEFQDLQQAGGGSMPAATAAPANATSATPDTAATGPRVIATGGPPLPTDDFGKYFLPKYLLKIGKTADSASFEDMTAAKTAYDKIAKSIPNTPTELAIVATDPSRTPAERDMATRALKKIQADKVNISVQTASAKADAGGLTGDDFARAGEQYARTGVMPAMGRDSATRAKIVHAGNQWARDNNLNASDVVKMQAAYAGDKESLKKFQGQRDQIVSFEQTAQKNLDNFIGLASKVVDTGSPWLNLPMRQLSEKLVGSANMAAVNAARQVANNEVAKVTSGGGLSGVLSDSARHEVESYNPKDATLAQTLAVAKVLKNDMANRHQTMDATLEDIKSRIGGGGATTPAAAGGGRPPLSSFEKK